MAFWAAAVPALISAGGSLLAANETNDAIDASTDITRQTNADNIRMLTGMALQDRQDNLPIQQSEGTARNALLALANQPQMQRDLDAPNYLQQIFDGTAGGGSSAYGPGTGQVAPNAPTGNVNNVFGIGSWDERDVVENDLAANLLGDDWADPVSTKINEEFGFNIHDPLNLHGLFDVGDGADRARWDYTDENVHRLDPNIDYQAYYDANPDIASIDQSKYRTGAIKGYDFDGDGQLGPQEIAQWHIGSGYAGEDGRNIPYLEAQSGAVPGTSPVDDDTVKSALFQDQSIYGAGASTAGAIPTTKTKPPWAAEGEYNPSTTANNEATLSGEVIDKDGVTVLNTDGQYATYTADEAYDNFLTSGRAKSMLPQAEELQNNILGNSAASGKLFSGTTANAVANNLVSNYTAPAYNAYVNDLSRLAGTGQSLTSDTSSLANNLASINSSTGNAASLAALNRTNPYGAALQGAATGWANSGGYTS